MEKLWRRASLAAAKRTPVRPIRSRLAAPVASITFDDVPQSAACDGTEALERAGRVGTFYVCGAHTGTVFEGKVQHRLADLERLRDAGHELACHGFAHLDATRADLPALERDLEANRDFMTAVLGAPPPESFAYPFGATSVPSKRFYSARFATCRGVLSGLNAERIDLSELRAFLLRPGGIDRRRLERLIKEAWRRSAWLVFFTHEVASEPTAWGCRPSDLEALISQLSDAGIEILPVREAARRAVAPIELCRVRGRLGD